MTEAEKRAWPKYTDDQKARLKLDNHWPDEVTQEMIIELRTRKGLADRVVQVMKSDIFKDSREEPWMSTFHEDDTPHEELNAIHDGVGLRVNLSTVFDFEVTLGCAGLALGLQESMGTVLALGKEPKGVTGLNYVKPIPKTLMKTIYPNTDPSRKEPGQIDRYDMILIEDGQEKDTEVVGSRILHVSNNILDDNPEGVSIFKAPYNYFLALDQIDVAAGEIPARMASPLPTLTYPTSIDPDEKEASLAMFTDINIYKQFMYPDEYKFQLLETDIALPIKDYAAHCLEMISSSMVGSRWALYGPAQGTQSTSDTALRQWYGWVVTQRRNVVDPWIHELDHRLMFWGIVKPEAGIYYVWNNPQEANKKEEAEIYLMQTEALNNNMDALLKAQTLNMTIDTEGEVWRLRMANGDGSLAVPMGYANDRPKRLVKPKTRPPLRGLDNARLIGMGKATPAGEAEKAADVFSMADEQAIAELFDEWDADTEMDEARLLQFTRGEQLAWADEVMTAIRPLWPGEDTGIETPAAPAGEAASDVLQYLDAWSPNLAGLQASSLLHFTNGYKIQDMHTITALGKYGLTSVKLPTNDPASFQIGDPNAVQMLESTSLEFSAGTDQTFRREMRNSINMGLQQGWSYQKTNKHFMNALDDLGFGAKDKGAPRTIQRHMHTIRSEARHDEMRKAGVDLVTMIVTLDGNARDDHLQWHEKNVTMDFALGIESEHGCRCADVPVLAYEQKLAESDARREAGVAS